jgi:hypothetical protein
MDTLEDKGKEIGRHFEAVFSKDNEDEDPKKSFKKVETSLQNLARCLGGDWRQGGYQ